MSKKETKSSNGTMNLSEISTIRDILMGQQIGEFQSQINELHARIDELENQLAKKSESLLKSSEEKEIKLQSLLENKITTVHQKLETSVEKLDTKFVSNSQNDKEIIGKLLSELGQKLVNSK